MQTGSLSYMQYMSLTVSAAGSIFHCAFMVHTVLTSTSRTFQFLNVFLSGLWSDLNADCG